MSDHYQKFSALQGKTLRRIVRNGDDQLDFECDDGETYRMFHTQGCCESVFLESVVGDFGDLIGTPILVADERSSNDDPPGFKHQYEPESQTWTFYTLRTIKGSVDLRWHGSSNGYYSEGVDFMKVCP